MSTLHPEIARALMAERQRDLFAAQRGRQARLTRSAAKRPQPAGQRTPGLLARLVPWFGGRVQPA